VATVRVLVPDSDNLQYVAFWVARGAGYFEEEGVTVDLLVPDVPAQAIAWVIAGEAPVAVLPPPVYLQLVADRFPVQLVANLLQNDPIDLIVRRSVFEQRHMSATAPLRERLASLKGLRVGVAPGPPARLRALFTSVGLDADRDVQIVIRKGQDQNEAFAGDQCDALYAHTPYLERALDDQDAVMLVNQSAGEVPSLAMRQIHALVVRDDFLGAHQPAVAAMVRAIARAEVLVHTDLAATEDAVMRAIPSMDRRHLHTLLGLYQAAVPALPRVTVEGLAPALALFPANRTAPSLEGVPLADFVATDVNVAHAVTVSTSAPPPAAPRHWPLWPGWVAVVLALVAFAATVAVIRRRAAR
jgi:NitT/TauT family transport system substrate-binding protein